MNEPAWFVRQRLAREKKKELLLRYRASLTKGQGHSRANPSDSDQEIKSVVPAAVAASDNSVSRQPTQLTAFGRAQIELYRQGQGTALQPNDALINLVNLYLEAATTKSATIVLTWPGTVTVIPLIHVFATLERWASGDKQGLRGLLYPAKANTFYPLNHLFFNREQIARWGQKLYESPTQPNPLVTRSLMDKDPFLLALNSLIDISDSTALNPCINEIIPHFFKPEATKGWGHYGENLLENLAGRLRSRAHKKALKTNLEHLGDPRTAPDALFAISYRHIKRDLRDAFRIFKDVEPPEVVLIDVTRPVRTSVKGWRGRVSGFFDSLTDAFPENRPGIILMTDDPSICFSLKKSIEKQLQKSTRRLATPSFRFAFKAIACPYNDDGLRKNNTPLSAPEPRKFRVEITDTEASRLVDKFYKTATKLKLDSSSTEPLRAAANFLHKLSALPSSVEALSLWLDQRQADARWREQFSWPAYRAKLTSFVDRHYTSGHRLALETTLKQADLLCRNYQTGTPLAHKLAREVGATATSTKRIAVVFTRPMYRLLAGLFLARYANYKNAKSFADFSERVRFLLSRDLMENLTDDWATRYIFASVDDESLRLIVTDNRIPVESVILLTYRSAIYMRLTLNTILHIDEFKCYKPRIQLLLKQLSEHLDSSRTSIILSNDFVPPSFSFVASGGSDDTDAIEKTTWRVELDDGRTLARSPGTSVYLYDPAKEDASPSGFRRTVIQHLKEGDHLFVMSEDLREMVEECLKQAGVPVSHDKPFEEMLRQYHHRVVTSLNERFPVSTLLTQVQLLRESIEKQHPEIEDPPQNLRYWVNLGASPDIPFDQLAPHAPRTLTHFQAFAEALGFSPTETSYYWRGVIQPIRINRRIDGRHLGEVYTKVLFDMESVIVHSGLSKHTVEHLYQGARDNVHLVMAVIPRLDENKEL